MNQGKFGVVKQEMARVNMLGISELKWTGLGEFSSNDHDHGHLLLRARIP